ncbi:MAG TPA: NRAMP family divalent metal transporter [Acidothermaceae bacterium]|nr:NRAMP family divalent metal transporter [Acidothermaceae bacterium]
MATSRGGGASDGAQLIRPSFGPEADRRSVLDRAHRGDIEGAFGTVRAFDTGPRTSWRRRLATLLAVMGPGVIVMVADNDGAGLSLYAQAGQDHGFRLLWLLFLLAPVLFVNQEMVARLGAVTGAGHARLIFERFGRRWGAFAIGDLLVLNMLTIVTEFIGVSLALDYFHVSRFVSVPLAALTLIAVTVTGSFRGWERAMYVAVAASVVAIPLAALAISHVARSGGVHAVELPAHPLRTNGVLFVIAFIGTTVAPWQLFLQQSNVVDKRVTSRWIHFERVDTAVGTGLFVLGSVAVLTACAVAFDGGPLSGAFVDAGHVATGLRAAAGPWAGALFALALLNGSVLGAAAVTLATSYAIGDATGLRHSLHRSWRQATAFHGTFVALVVVAAAVVLLPNTPLGLITVMVNVLAGVLLPSATVFLLLLCNDREVLGPWTNPRWLNVVTSLIVTGLVVLSALLVLTTLFPGLPIPVIALVLAAAAAAGCAIAVLLWSRGSPKQDDADGGAAHQTWTMPPLETLTGPRPSSGRLVGLVALRVYLIGAAALVIAKAVQLAT